MTTTTAPAVSTAERLARVALSLSVEAGDPFFLGLVRLTGSAATVLDGVRADPERHDRFPDLLLRLRGVDASAELERAAERGIRFVVPGDAEWPAQLDDLPSAGALQERGDVPIGLWVSGPLGLDRLAGSVAVVGARDSSSYGEQVASEIAATVGMAGRAVVSGAAIGIDEAAHRGALTVDAPTVAVLACGADRDYPVRHAPLLAHLRSHHAVVSEVPLGGAPHRHRFLSRNRLIAALGVGTVVVEAAIRSGALNTLNWSQRLNRQAMGVPGPVTSVRSAGVHQHLRLGGTSLVTGGDDVLELVAEMGEHLRAEPRAPEAARDRLSVRERQILDALPAYRPASAASIARVAGVSERDVVAALDRFEQAGLVEAEENEWRLAQDGRP